MKRAAAHIIIDRLNGPRNRYRVGNASLERIRAYVNRHPPKRTYGNLSGGKEWCYIGVIIEVHYPSF